MNDNSTDESSTDDNVTEEQLRLIYNNIHDLVFLIEVTDVAGEYRVQSVNHGYLRATGLTADDLVGKSMTDVLGAGEIDYVRARYQEAIDHKEPFHYLTRTRMRGEDVYLDTTLVPVFDEQKKCRFIIGASRDITQSHLERRALEREKRRAENYLNVAEAVMLALDVDGNVTMFNPKGYRLLGYPEGSLIGKNYFDAVIPESRREKFRDMYREAIETGRAGPNVNYVQCANGERVLISWSSTIMRNEEGEVSGILSSGEDITERRQAEKSMIVSQRMLAAEEVVSAVAHDFNNALQGILGNIEIALKNASVDERARSNLKTASDLAADAAERIQALQRISDPAQEGERGPVDIVSLAEDVVAQTRHLWKDEAQRQGKSIDVRLRRHGFDPIETTGNVNELRSVLYNVVKNAIEAIEDDGKISIDIGTEEANCWIRITDTGAGMDFETSHRVFQPFFSTKGMESGRGLGLSASFGIIRAHHGEISVLASEPGEGTTIEIQLPRLEAGVSGAVQSTGATRSKSLHILWVDDDPEIRSLAVAYLDSLGHSGEIAESGPEALTMLEDGNYDLVITEIGMPGMTGIELAGKIHERTDGRLPVVALTGWGDQVGIDANHELAAIMKKPIRMRELETTLESIAAAIR